MEKAYHVNIIRRFILSFCVLILIFISYGLFTLLDINRLSGLTRTIYDHPMVVSNAALQANIHITKMHRSMKDVVLFDSPERIFSSISAVNEQEKAVYRHLNTIRDKILGEEGRSLESEARSLFDDWRPIRQEVIALVDRGQREAAARITIGKGADHVAELEKKMLSLTNYARNKASVFMNGAENVHSRVGWTSAVFLLSGVFLSLLIAFITLKNMTASQKEIIESKLLLDSAIDNAPIGMLLLKQDGYFFRVNRAYCSITGYTEEELKKMTFQDLTHPDDHEIGARMIKKILDGEMKTASFQKRYVHKNGRTIHMQLTTALLRNGEGKPLYFFTQAQDITHRTLAEENLRKRNEYIEAILEKMPIGFALNTLDDGTTRYVNRKFQEIYGWPEKDLTSVDMFFENVFPDPVYREQFKAQVFKDIESGDPDRMVWKDIPITTKSGEKRYTTAINIPMIDQNLMISTVQDTTLRKKAEDNIKKHRNHMDELVGERTRDLEEKTQKIEKTQQALTYLLEDVNEASAETDRLNQELQAVNKELKDFSYIVSHDLKAPLRAVSQLAYWIAEDHGDAVGPDGKEKVDLLINRVKRMDGLISGILQYSRAGRAGAKRESINLKDMLEDVIKALASPHNIQISIDGALPELFGNRTGMEQVFQNLLGNALKFMDKPKGVVRVSCMDKGSQWQFNVSDNGPGINEKYHKRIFKIFQSLAPRDENESTGIGLTIVKKIIGQHGGKIWVESREGEGATFYFTLPKK